MKEIYDLPTLLLVKQVWYLPAIITIDYKE